MTLSVPEVPANSVDQTNDASQTVGMTEAFARKSWHGARAALPADVVDAIDAVGRELGQDGDTDAVLWAHREQDLGFLHAILGLMAITGVPLADAREDIWPVTWLS
jgi:hypothetical protein